MEYPSKTVDGFGFAPIGRDEPYRVFMTKDPLGEASDPNLYRMVGNSPTNWIDPLGLAIAMKPPKIIFPDWVPLWLSDLLNDMNSDPFIGPPIGMAHKADIKLINSIVKKCKLSHAQRDLLHDWIHGQDLGRKEIIELAEMIKQLYPNTK